MYVAARLLPRSLRRAVRLYAWRRLNLHWTLSSGIPIELKSPADWEAYNEIFVDGEYDPAIKRVLENASAQHSVVVLDIGANMGFFSLRTIDLNYRLGTVRNLDLTLVEGSPSVLSGFKQRAAYSTLTAAGACLIEGLAGKQDGYAILQESDMHLYNTIIESGRGAGSVGVKVPFVDLSCRFNKVESIDLLKCDIQGAEESFLENNRVLVAKCRAAVIELHHVLCSTEKCIRLLQEAGFTQLTTLRHNSSITVVHCER